jgi:hypothetical protein
VLVAEDEAAALQEDRGDLFFTTSVENRESPLYIGHYPGTHVQVHPYESHEDRFSRPPWRF